VNVLNRSRKYLAGLFVPSGYHLQETKAGHVYAPETQVLDAGKVAVVASKLREFTVDQRIAPEPGQPREDAARVAGGIACREALARAAGLFQARLAPDNLSMRATVKVVTP